MLWEQILPETNGITAGSQIVFVIGIFEKFNKKKTTFIFSPMQYFLICPLTYFKIVANIARWLIYYLVMKCVQKCLVKILRWQNLRTVEMPLLVTSLSLVEGFDHLCFLQNHFSSCEAWLICRNFRCGRGQIISVYRIG